MATSMNGHKASNVMAASMNGHKASELFEAQAHLYRHIYSFVYPMSIRCAVQLGIPDIIHKHGQPITLNGLVSALQVPQSKAVCVQRLMRLLAHNGFFAITKINENEEEMEAYVQTPASEVLVKGTAHCLSSVVEFFVNPSLIGTFYELGNWIQSEDVTVMETALGKDYYEFIKQNPANMIAFNKAMASDSQMVNLAVGDCKEVFDGLDSIVDVGGGTGTTAKIICEAFPKLKCIVFDLPEVVAGLSGCKNWSYVGGDMFNFVPQADAVLLKWILHNWNDDDCIKILEKCKNAISIKGTKGKVIIIDVVIDEKQDRSEMTKTKLLWDVVMMAGLNGRERSEEEWKKLFLGAGFKSYKIFPILGFRSLIEVYP